MGGSIVRARVKKKYCCVRGKRGGHYMKNKNIGEDVFCQLNLISKKGPNAKMRKKYAKKKIKHRKLFLARFAHSAFYKIHISGAANRHAPVQYPKYVFCCFFFFFFLSSQHDTNPLLHLYQFRKKYNYILANINSESSRVMFSFFLSSSSGSNIFVPQQIL